MTNYLANPSFEGSTITDYTDDPVASVAIARTTSEQRRGAYSLGVTPNSLGFDLGINVSDIGDMVVTTNSNYVISFDIFAPRGHEFRAFIGWSDASEHEEIRFTARGIWERKYLLYYMSTALPHAAALYIHRTSPYFDTTPFYLDGFLLTEGDEMSTYFDGDTLPFGSDNNYVWIGEAHNSQSFRSASEMSSGIIRNLQDYQYHVLGFGGLGLSPQNNIILENALFGGGTYQRGVDPIREYSIVGALARTNMADMLRNKASIERLLLNAHTMQQPMVVRAEMIDDTGKSFTQPLHLRSIYQGGFEGVVDNLYQERSSLQFQMDRPEILEDGDGGGILSTLESLTPARVERRLVGTGWDDWDGGVNNVVWDMKYNRHDGKVYVTGDMTTAGTGAVAVTNAAAWDIETETWEALPVSAGTPTGSANSIHVVEFLGDETILLGGEFTGYAGQAGDDYLVYYPDSGGGWDRYVVAAPVRDIAVAPDGVTFYALCSDPTGAANAYVYKCTHDTLGITLIGTLTYAGVQDPQLFGGCVAKDGTLYIAGLFDDVSGTPIDAFAMYDGSTWSDVGGGVSVPVILLQCGDVIEGDDGLIYVAGTFDTAGGISADGIASWNGQSYSALGGGIGGSFYGGPQLTWHDERLWVPSSSPDLEINGLSWSVWNGTNWTHVDYKFNGAQMCTFDSKGNWYTDQNGTLYGSGSSVLTNSGSSNADPVFVFKGEEVVYSGVHTWTDELWWIKNETTNQTIYLNLRVNKGETITLDFRRGRKRAISDTRGDITSFVLPSSDFANFYLAPGDNYITVYMDNPSGAPTELVAYAYWTIPYDYLGGAVI
jgi:hypothetical protein